MSQPIPQSTYVFSSGVQNPSLNDSQQKPLVTLQQEMHSNNVEVQGTPSQETTNTYFSCPEGECNEEDIDNCGNSKMNEKMESNEKRAYVHYKSQKKANKIIKKLCSKYDLDSTSSSTESSSSTDDEEKQLERRFQKDHHRHQKYTDKQMKKLSQYQQYQQYPPTQPLYYPNYYQQPVLQYPPQQNTMVPITQFTTQPLTYSQPPMQQPMQQPMQPQTRQYPHMQ
ncbi:hypothetical protein QTN25_003107 [Entamoeba marina]